MSWTQQEEHLANMDINVLEEKINSQDIKYHKGYLNQDEIKILFILKECLKDIKKRQLDAANKTSSNLPPSLMSSETVESLTVLFSNILSISSPKSTPSSESVVDENPKNDHKVNHKH